MTCNFEDSLINLQVRLDNKLVTSTELALVISQLGFTSDKNILDNNNKIINDVKVKKDDRYIRINYEIVADDSELQILRIEEIKEVNFDYYYVLIEENYEDLELIEQTVLLITSDFNELRKILYDKTNEVVEEPNYDEFIVLRGLKENPEYNRFIIHSYDKDII
jgi:hypothetical protein